MSSNDSSAWPSTRIIDLQNSRLVLFARVANPRLANSMAPDKIISRVQFDFQRHIAGTCQFTGVYCQSETGYVGCRVGFEAFGSVTGNLVQRGHAR